MKKVLHIFFLCLMSLVALVANAQITSVSELNNTTTYTLKTTERGYFLYNEATSTEALTSSYNLDGGQNATRQVRLHSSLLSCTALTRPKASIICTALVLANS